MVSEDEETNCINNIANINRFKSFKYKAKLLESTFAQPNSDHANGILKMQQLLFH